MQQDYMQQDSHAQAHNSFQVNKYTAACFNIGLATSVFFASQQA